MRIRPTKVVCLVGAALILAAPSGFCAALPTRDHIWDRGNSTSVYEQTFEADAETNPPSVLIYQGDPVLSNSSRRLPGGGYDGSDCWLLDVGIPPQKHARINLPIPELDPAGLHYSFLIKVESDPDFGLTDLALSIDPGPAPFLHAVYRVAPLEANVPKTGDWMAAIWNIWKGHCDVVYPGWVRVDGDTSTYFARGSRFGTLRFFLYNRTQQTRNVTVRVDDIKVIRREVATSPEMQAVLNTPRPVINYTREQILRARAAVNEQGEAAMPGWVKGMLALADKWLTEDITVPRMQAGYPTKYTCGNCKAFLRPNPPTGYVCTKCGKEHTGDLYDHLLAYERHKALGAASHALGFAWQWTDDERYARRCETILLAYADAIPHFELGHNWLGTCWLMEDFLFGYDYVCEHLSAASRARINDDFLKIVRRLYHYNHFYPEGYARLWQVCAWISLLAKDADWINYLLFSSVGNREVLLHYGLTEDMVSVKGPAYHGDIVRALNNMGRTLENCDIRYFDERMRPVYDVVFKQIFPDKSLPGFGHSSVGYPAAMYDYKIPYRYYRDPKYLAFCSGKTLEEDRIFYSPDPVAGTGVSMRLSSSQLDALGLTMLRSQPDNKTVLGLSWGTPQRNDPTRLDFQLYGAGGHQIWSSGTTWYGNPLFQTWYGCSISRNMLLVDEGTQTPQGGKCLWFETNGSPQVVAAELVNAFSDTRIVRVAAVFDGGEAALVDLFSSPRPRTVDWVCQLPGEVETSIAVEPVAAPFTPTNGYQVLTNICRASASAPFRITLRHKAGPLTRGVVLTPAPVDGTTLYLAQGYAGHTSVRSGIGLLRRSLVSHTVYATLFQPFEGATNATTDAVAVRAVEPSADPLHFDRVQVRLSFAGGSCVLTIHERSEEDGTYRTKVESQWE
ncbi:MAG: hypothetical protein PHR35_11700 [Kiritimatiellae bacterium]|nr:hypothetical protein [Kiritimatiellia bacterium]